MDARDPPRIVLFVCIENAARSLIAEAIFNRDPPIGWRAESGGTRPASAADPRTARLLREAGVDPPDHPPRPVSVEEVRTAERLVTMGCLDDSSCPAFMRDRPVEDWGLPDPRRLDDVGFGQVIETIRSRVERLQQELRSEGSPGAPERRPPETR
ncbi:MAG: low molecular weight phosphatase family protein [Thermoplasmata archaeon]|nr:low molecular weight phosphatase family protein [Thermoplasmata archaeon]